MSTERILVVDDEAGVRSSLQGILEDEGYRVDTVESAEAALARISTGRYDLVSSTSGSRTWTGWRPSPGSANGIPTPR